MDDEPHQARPRGGLLSHVRQALILAAVVALGGGAIYYVTRGDEVAKTPAIDVSSQSKRSPRVYRPTEAQWAVLTVEPVEQRVFRSEHTTEGKISIDEDRSTPIYSPYPGRVTKLLAKPGDMVKVGQPLFLIEAADMVLAQNDFLTAVAGLNKSKSGLDIKQIIARQNQKLYDSRAGALRDLQQSQADVAQAQSDVRSAEAAIEASRNRLRILGKTDDEVDEFQKSGKISPDTPIYSPIAGTVVQRKVGPGQYVSYTSIGSVDPVFMIGDLSTVWLLAYVREGEAPKMKAGQQLDFTVLAYPDRTFHANITYVSAALDPVTRRLLVRATIDNADGRFKPEMFANVTIYTEEGDNAPAVRRESVIYEGDSARVWVVNEDRSIRLRQIKTGLVSGGLIQVLDGLKIGEKVVTKGSLFIDRAAPSS